MSKSLRSYPKELRLSVAQRRVKSNTFGLGYWAAIDFIKKHAGEVKEIRDHEPAVGGNG